MEFLPHLVPPILIVPVRFGYRGMEAGSRCVVIILGLYFHVESSLGIGAHGVEFSGVGTYVRIGVDFIFRDFRQDVVVECEGAVDGGEGTGGQLVRKCTQISAGLRRAFREPGIDLQCSGEVVIPETAEDVAGDDCVVQRAAHVFIKVAFRIRAEERVTGVER